MEYAFRCIPGQPSNGRLLRPRHEFGSTSNNVSGPPNRPGHDVQGQHAITLSAAPPLPHNARGRLGRGPRPRGPSRRPSVRSRCRTIRTTSPAARGTETVTGRPIHRVPWGRIPTRAFQPREGRRTTSRGSIRCEGSRSPVHTRRAVDLRRAEPRPKLGGPGES
jgi:hypothetical protein